MSNRGATPHSKWNVRMQPGMYACGHSNTQFFKEHRSGTAGKSNKLNNFGFFFLLNSDQDCFENKKQYFKMKLVGYCNEEKIIKCVNQICNQCY